MINAQTNKDAALTKYELRCIHEDTARIFPDLGSNYVLWINNVFHFKYRGELSLEVSLITNENSEIKSDNLSWRHMHNNPDYHSTTKKVRRKLTESGIPFLFNTLVDLKNIKGVKYTWIARIGDDLYIHCFKHDIQLEDKQINIFKSRDVFLKTLIKMDESPVKETFMKYNVTAVFSGKQNDVVILGKDLEILNGLDGNIKTICDISLLMHDYEKSGMNIKEFVYRTNSKKSPIS